MGNKLLKQNILGMFLLSVFIVVFVTACSFLSDSKKDTSTKVDNVDNVATVSKNNNSSVKTVDKQKIDNQLTFEEFRQKFNSEIKKYVPSNTNMFITENYSVKSNYKPNLDLISYHFYEKSGISLTAIVDNSSRKVRNVSIHIGSNDVGGPNGGGKLIVFRAVACFIIGVYNPEIPFESRKYVLDELGLMREKDIYKLLDGFSTVKGQTVYNSLFSPGQSEGTLIFMAAQKSY